MVMLDWVSILTKVKKRNEGGSYNIITINRGI